MVTVEQIIKTKAPKWSIALKIVCIAACILAATTIPSTQTAGFLLLVILIVFTVLVFRYFNAEYEYSFTDGELVVERIASRSARKRCGVYAVDKATLIARPASQEALRLEHMDYRTSDYTSKSDNVENVVVIYTYNSNNEMERIYIEPDERMTAAMRECAGREAVKGLD
jgi:hypothetical protein